MTKPMKDAPDAFDLRIDALKGAHASPFEIEAAMAVFERVRTAQAIGQAIAPEGASESLVMSLLDALSDEVAALQQMAFEADAPPPNRFKQ